MSLKRKSNHMTDDEIMLAWTNYKEDPNNTNKNTLVEYYYYLVKRIADNLSRKMNYKVNKEELASHGVDGLYTAIDGYDMDRNIKFETYAYRRIHGSMIDALRKEDWVPRSVRLRQAKLEKSRSRMEKEQNRTVTEEEVFQEAGFDKDDYFKKYSKYNPTLISSIDNTVMDHELGLDDNNKDCNKSLEDRKELPSDICMMKLEFFNKIKEKFLTDIESDIIYFYYYESMTMKEVSKEIGLSESRISQIHQDAIGKLKNQILKNKEEFFENIFCY